MKGKGKENFLRDSTLAGEVEIFIQWQEFVIRFDNHTEQNFHWFSKKLMYINLINS